MVDWNGDVFLCTQDWNRRVRCGNLNYEHIESVWNSKIFKNIGRRFSGQRSASPCMGCNADGTKHGNSTPPHGKLLQSSKVKVLYS